MPRTNRRLRLEKKRSPRASLVETPRSIRRVPFKALILPGAHVWRSRGGVPRARGNLRLCETV